MNSFFARFGHGLLDLVYPPMCLVCEAQTDTGTLCERCLRSFLPIPDPVCAVCGRPQEAARCGHCERFVTETGSGYAFDAARAGAVYAGTLRHAIHLLKYRGKESLGEPLGAFLESRITADALLTDAGHIQVVAAVPIHPSRERERGYNQARVLAEPVAFGLGVPVLAPPLFVRRVKTAQQMGLSDKERRGNVVSETFAVTDGAAVRGRHVLLIDDVYTTGATVSACAAALKNAGANTVRVACLAAGG